MVMERGTRNVGLEYVGKDSLVELQGKSSTEERERSNPVSVHILQLL